PITTLRWATTATTLRTAAIGDFCRERTRKGRRSSSTGLTPRKRAISSARLVGTGFFARCVNRGAAMKTLIKLLVAAAIVYASWKCGNAYFRFYQLKDAAQDAALFGAGKSPD